MRDNVRFSRFGQNVQCWPFSEDIIIIMIIIIIIIIMCIYNALIDTVNAHKIPVELEIIFYTNTDRQSY